MMPSLLRGSARNSADGRTRRGSTVRGIAIPCLAPIILIHMHRTLWMWAAIIRTVRRGTPGTVFDHIAGGRFSMRYIVTRLFVRQAAIRERPVSKSVGTFVHSGSDAGRFALTLLADLSPGNRLRTQREFRHPAPKCRGSHVESCVARIEVGSDVGEEKGRRRLSVAPTSTTWRQEPDRQPNARTPGRCPRPRPRGRNQEAPRSQFASVSRLASCS
jgi:hypothetical protein